MNASRLLSECTVLYVYRVYPPTLIKFPADLFPCRSSSGGRGGWVRAGRNRRRLNTIIPVIPATPRITPLFRGHTSSACCRRKVYHPCIKHRPFIHYFSLAFSKTISVCVCQGVGRFTAWVRNARSRYDPPCILVMGGLHLRCLQVKKVDHVISKMNNESLFEKLVIRDE